MQQLNIRALGIYHRPSPGYESLLGTSPAKIGRDGCKGCKGCKGVKESEQFYFVLFFHLFILILTLFYQFN